MARTTSITRSTLIEEITAAFDSVTRDDGVTLRQATVLDNSGSPKEEATARARATETRWQDVPEEDIAGVQAVMAGNLIRVMLGGRLLTRRYQGKQSARKKQRYDAEDKNLGG
jgi:hypothetical protein